MGLGEVGFRGAAARGFWPRGEVDFGSVRGRFCDSRVLSMFEILRLLNYIL